MSEIKYLTNKEYIEYIPDKNVMLVFIDGKQNTTYNEFLNTVWEKFSFPHGQYKNSNAYLDWFRDLSWIDNKDIIIIISNYNDFLKNEKPEEKQYFILDFEKIILPFWENDALGVFEDEKMVKNIKLFIVE